MELLQLHTDDALRTSTTNDAQETGKRRRKGGKRRRKGGILKAVKKAVKKVVKAAATTVAKTATSAVNAVAEILPECNMKNLNIRGFGATGCGGLSNFFSLLVKVSQSILMRAPLLGARMPLQLLLSGHEKTFEIRKWGPFAFYQRSHGRRRVYCKQRRLPSQPITLHWNERTNQ